LPLTKHKLAALSGYGIYTNYYVGNKVVLVPAFDDPNDSVAAEQLQSIYPNREVVSIPFTEVYRDGGLIHCVTQQQPQKRRK
jgi:agmatine deiminase